MGPLPAEAAGDTMRCCGARHGLQRWLHGGSTAECRPSVASVVLMGPPDDADVRVEMRMGVTLRCLGVCQR